MHASEYRSRKFSSATRIYGMLAMAIVFLSTLLFHHTSNVTLLATISISNQPKDLFSVDNDDLKVLAKTIRPLYNVFHHNHSFLMTAYDNDFIGIRLAEHEFFDIHVTDTIIRFQKVYGGEIIDAGGHMGSQTIPVAHACQCRVHVIEAHPITFQKLYSNIQMNRLQHLVKAYNVAIVKDFSIDSVKLLSTENIKNATNKGAAKVRSAGDGFEVRAMTMDALNFPGDVKVVKMDIEGLELDAILGWQKFLTRSPPCAMILETKLVIRQGLKEELDRIMKSLGFTGEKLDDRYGLKGWSGDHVYLHQKCPHPLDTSRKFVERKSR